MQKTCHLQFLVPPPSRHYIYCTHFDYASALCCYVSVLGPHFICSWRTCPQATVSCQAWPVQGTAGRGGWAVGQGAVLLRHTAPGRLYQLVTAVAKAFISCPANRLQFINFERNYFITAWLRVRQGKRWRVESWRVQRGYGADCCPWPAQTWQPARSLLHIIRARLAIGRLSLSPVERIWRAGSGSGSNRGLGPRLCPRLGVDMLWHKLPHRREANQSKTCRWQIASIKRNQIARKCE